VVTVVEVQEPLEAVQAEVAVNGVVTTVEIPTTVVQVEVPSPPDVVMIEVITLGPQGPSGPSTIPFTRSGELAPMTGDMRLYMEYDGTIRAARATVAEAPTGSSLIVDVNKNDTSIYATTQANRPTVLATELTGLGGEPDDPDFVQGDYFTIDIDQVGSTLPGTTLVVTLTLERD
jgi:hypothetical protein